MGFQRQRNQPTCIRDHRPFDTLHSLWFAPSLQPWAKTDSALFLPTNWLISPEIIPDSAHELVEHLPEGKLYVFAIIPTFWGQLRNRMGDYVSTDLFPFSNHHQIVAASMTRLLLRRKFSEVENSILYQRKPFEAARVKEGAQGKKVPKMPSQGEMQRQVEAVMKGINPRTGSKI